MKCNISFSNFSLSENELWQIRRELYHSDGQGFVVMRNYVTTELAQHISDYWCHFVESEKTHEKLAKFKNPFFVNCPCYFDETKFSRVYHNPFWSNSFDSIANQVGLSITFLRSQIERKLYASEIFPTVGRRCVIPRVVVTKAGENILEPHSDYGLGEKDPQNVDLSRLQCTLFLSEFGKDYEGSGFMIENNQNKVISIEKELEVLPGDLLIWKYSNQHSIDRITELESGCGFVRMLFPPELITGDNIFNINFGFVFFEMLRRIYQTFKRKIFRK